MITARSQEVWAQIAQGRTNREIAQGLGLSETTVKTYVTRLFRAIGVTNRTQAAIAFERFGGAAPIPQHIEDSATEEEVPCNSTK